MKTIVISDIHGDLIDIEECDILLICGDIVPLEVQRNFGKSLSWISKEFTQWISKLPTQNVIMTWGNHDFIGQSCGLILEDLNKVLCDMPKLHLLSDSEITVNGLRIYGTPFGAYPPGWAFNELPDKLKECYSKIPYNLDILITHDPPKLMGYDLTCSKYGALHAGSEELTWEVRKKKPRYHFFGHIHEGSHELLEIGGTKYCNVSIKNEYYKTFYKPLVIEI